MNGKGLGELLALFETGLDRRQLIATLLTLLERRFSADRCLFHLFSADGQRVQTYQRTGGELREESLDRGHPHLEEVVRERRALRFEEVDLGGSPREVLFCPVGERSQTPGGVLELSRIIQGDVPREGLEALGEIGAVAQAALENSRLYQQVIQKNIEFLKTKQQLLSKMEEMEDFLEIETFAGDHQDLDEVLHFAMQKVLKLVDADGVTLALCNPRGDALRCWGTSRTEAGRLDHFEVQQNQGVIGYALRFGKTRRINNLPPEATSYSRYAGILGLHPTGLLCVPIPGGDGILGAMEVFLGGRREELGFGQASEVSARLVAGQIGRFLQHLEDRRERRKSENLVAIGQALSGIIHDFKTPMSVLSGLFFLTVEEECAEERRKNYEQAQRQLKLIQSMVEDTLAFARGQASILQRQVYCHKFMQELESHFKTSLQGSPELSLSVVVRYAGKARFDEDKLRRVLCNLVNNAADAVKGKGSIEVVLLREGEDLRFTVKDDGSGIPECIRDRLFDSFVTHGKANGTGLGLAIAHDIVVQHGGSISFETQTGKGTCFTVTLLQAVKNEEA